MVDGDFPVAHGVDRPRLGFAGWLSIEGGNILATLGRDRAQSMAAVCEPEGRLSPMRVENATRHNGMRRPEENCKTSIPRFESGRRLYRPRMRAIVAPTGFSPRRSLRSLRRIESSQ